MFHEAKIVLILAGITCIAGDRAPTWDACGCYWGTWEPWSSCTKTCGGGYQRRSRLVWHHDTPECAGFDKCASNDMGSDHQSCNTNCFNGGTCMGCSNKFGGYCRCPVGTKGSCCEQVVTCGAPASISNGYFTGRDYTYNHQVQYFCNSKYNMTGTAVRRCTQYGYWTNSAPTCHFVQSCESSPCQNGATCVNELDGYTCLCGQGWTGKICETDIQPPVILSCPDDKFINTSNMTEFVEWITPEFVDLFNNSIQVTSNYQQNKYTFPWGVFTVQYSAVKPLNGLRSECIFNISIRPNPCVTLPPPENGLVVCNGWLEGYASVCMPLCKKGFRFLSTYDPVPWLNCGATGYWLPPIQEECVPDDVLPTTTSLPQIEDCSGEQQPNLTSFYIEELRKSQFNRICIDYASDCRKENVVVRC